jgi:hypothetical protein
MNRRPSSSRAPAGQRGSLLLEVAVAVVLVGLFVAPLATSVSRAVAAARAVREQESATGATGGEAEAAGGEWGPRVTTAWWRPGPVLHVRVSAIGGHPATAGLLGLWVDGWLVAEEQIRGDEPTGRADAEVQVGPQLWNGRAESELVVRVRAPGGSWGPPWRAAVPATPGNAPEASPASVEAPAPSVVVHRPEVGTSSLTVSWSAGSLAAPPFGLIFPLSPALDGWTGATLDGRAQWWRMEEGRSVDVYY